jgi:aldose 1-epimerase
VDAATDLRAGRRVGELSLDTAFGDLVRDDDGRIRTTLTAPDGRSLTLWQGEGFDYVKVFTTDRYPGHPLALAVEPMTAPADALNSGQGLRWLAPGESWELRWGIAFDPHPRD